MNPTIKFSHKYPKLAFGGPDKWVKQAVLLQVLKVNLGELSPAFLKYDTGNGMYRFSHRETEMYLLLFSVNDGLMDFEYLFSTVRPLTSGNYYPSHVGHTFDILIAGRDY